MTISGDRMLQVIIFSSLGAHYGTKRSTIIRVQGQNDCRSALYDGTDWSLKENGKGSPYESE
jgi:hypothetical protein